MSEKAYYENVNIENTLKLRETLKCLPGFCREYFIGIEQTTASRTRLAYAYDLTVFFNFIKENNPSLKNKDITEYPLSLLDDISGFFCAAL